MPYDKTRLKKNDYMSNLRFCVVDPVLNFVEYSVQSQRLCMYKLNKKRLYVN